MSASPLVSILLTGSELLDGRTQDTNARWLGQRLAELGIPVHRTIICGDTQAQIVESLTFLAGDSTIIIVSGGLGPTTDDLTREALAEFVDQPLEESPESLQKLKKWYAARGRSWSDSSNKQALFPKGAAVITNPSGTADAFSLSHRNAQNAPLTIFSLPGVPKELTALCEQTVLPRIAEMVALKTFSHSFSTFGLAEADVGTRIEALHLPPEIFVAYRALTPEIHVKLISQSPELLPQAVVQVREALEVNRYIFSEAPDQTLPEAVHQSLLEHHKTVAVAESATAGLLGATLATYAGSSTFLRGGTIVYSNDAKRELGVLPETLDRHTAVSAEVARELAVAVRNRYSSDFGISITGYAGPEGGAPQDPVGTVYLGVASAAGVEATRLSLFGDRSRIRQFAVHHALRAILQRLVD